tara:strand:- start:612 stop:740 length:129 start_codon:yes stop_codon:yes gene_type:complete
MKKTFIENLEMIIKLDAELDILDAEVWDYLVQLESELKEEEE